MMDARMYQATDLCSVALTNEEKIQNEDIHTQWTKAPNEMEPIDKLIGRVNNHVYNHCDQYKGTGVLTIARIIMDAAGSSLFSRTPAETKLYQLAKLLEIILRYKNKTINNTANLISKLEKEITSPLRTIGLVSKRQQFIDEFKALSGPGTVNQGPIDIELTVFHRPVETVNDNPMKCYEHQSRIKSCS